MAYIPLLQWIHGPNPGPKRGHGMCATANPQHVSSLRLCFQVNTLLALISGAVCAYVFSGLVNHNRFLMFDIARSTIAGGVAISSIANMLVPPHVAMIIGLVRIHPRELQF